MSEKRASILEKAHFLLIHRGFPPLTKTISSYQLGMQIVTDTSLLHHQKDLFKCPELNAIKSHETRIDNFIKNTCLPFPLKEGIYILPVDLTQKVEDALQAHLITREPLLDAFVDVYDVIVANTASRLGPALFNPLDYLPKSSVKAAFKFEWHYLKFGVSDYLQKINKDIAMREHKKLEAEYNDAESAIEQLLRKTAKGVISRMTNNLSIQNSGRKNKVYQATIDSLNEFNENYPARNLTDDVRMATIIEKVKVLMAGVDADKIRENEGLRLNLKSQLDSVEKEVNELLLEKVQVFAKGETQRREVIQEVEDTLDGIDE